jgi:hypothetical protein
MARKVVNRKELREEHEAAERKEAAGQKPVKKTTKKATKKATRKSTKKPPKEVRLKAFWGVFSQSLNPVVLFEYSQRKQAQKKADQLSESKKSPHFVQLVKKVIEE